MLAGGVARTGWVMIDWDRVRQLRDEIGGEDFSEVVSLFLAEADEVVARLNLEGGAKALAADLHFLKGAALNLGFDTLSALCQEGERRACDGDLSVDLNAVAEAYRRARAAFESGAAKALAA